MSFVEEQERGEARDLLTQESMDHEDWLIGVEAVFTNLKLADMPPAEVSLNTAQILLGIDTVMRVTQDNLNMKLQDIESPLEDITKGRPSLSAKGASLSIQSSRRNGRNVLPQAEMLLGDSSSSGRGPQRSAMSPM